MIMKFGLSKTDWQLLEQLALAPLRKNGFRLYVFGSRARGDFQPFSDIDILIETPTNATVPSLALIREALEESDLPIKVDLVLASEVASTYLPEILRQRIEIPY